MEIEERCEKTRVDASFYPTTIFLYTFISFSLPSAFHELLMGIVRIPNTFHWFLSKIPAKKAVKHWMLTFYVALIFVSNCWRWNILDDTWKLKDNKNAALLFFCIPPHPYPLRNTPSTYIKKNPQSFTTNDQWAEKINKMRNFSCHSSEDVAPNVF